MTAINCAEAPRTTSVLRLRVDDRGRYQYLPEINGRPVCAKWQAGWPNRELTIAQAEQRFCVARFEVKEAT